MVDSVGQSSAGEHLRAAQAGMRKVKGVLAQPSPTNADQASIILREVEVQLGCAVAILEKNGPPPDGEFRSALEELQGEVATLARFLSGADKLLSDWLGAVQTRRGGYTHRGQAAPLVLVNKVTVEG
jgi:hypothetical protein